MQKQQSLTIRVKNSVVQGINERPFPKHQKIKKKKTKALFMKKILLLLLLFISVISCKQPSINVDEETAKAKVEKIHAGSDSLPIKADRTLTEIDTLSNATDNAALVLTSNALQVVNKQTGTTTPLPFGLKFNELVAIVERVLDLKVNSIQVNSDCGAGPLKMAAWSNGLTLVFQDKRKQRDWIFEGWFMRTLPNALPRLTTLAGVGIGSTRAEMENAYQIQVSKTSLGYEFSTASNLYGIFSGSNKEATITDMWSGLSCNFR